MSILRSGECSIAFKEWAAVCRALAADRQSIILRKGGIAEDGGDFKPEHDLFWLFPTHIHQQEQGTKPEAKHFLLETFATPNGSIPLQYLVQVERIYHCTRLTTLRDLDAYHIWTPETVEKRFHYRTPGLYVLVVKVFSIDRAVEIPMEPHYDGCKTWVKLSEPIPCPDAKAVVPERTFRDRLLEIDLIMEPSSVV